MTPEEKAAADKAAADKAAADKAAADKAAADKKAADEANKEPVIVVGDSKLGGPFNIRGEGFGNSGTLTIGGVPIKTSRWDDRVIKGVTPPGLSGDVVLTGAFGVRKGTFPHVYPVTTKTTTTTVETK